MPDRIGYAVAVYNQASRQPDLVEGSFTDELDIARQTAADGTEADRAFGRRDWYVVVELVEVDDDA